VSSLPAQAEEVDSALPSASTDYREKDEPLQWTPASVTVISKEDINEVYRRDLEDLEGITPGLIIDRISGAAQGAMIAIRGIGSRETSRGFDPAVAVVVDGVAVGTHAGQMMVLFDFDKVEVSRGPQGAFGGANALGGKVSISRSKPTGELSSDLKMVVGGNYDRQELQAVVNFPTISDIKTKAAFRSNQSKSTYMSNVVSGRLENQIDRTFLSLSALWDGREDLKIQYIVDIDRDDSNTPALLNITQQSERTQPGDQMCIDFPANCGSDIAPRIPEFNDEHTVGSNFSNQRSFEGNYHTLLVDFDFMDYSLSSITGFRSTDESSDQDLDATSIDYLSRSSNVGYDQFTQEFRADSESDGKSQYSFGLYFSNSDYSLRQDDFFLLQSFATAGLPTSCINCDGIRISSHQETDTFAIFGQLQYQLNDQWTADIALRAEELKKTIHHETGSLLLSPTIYPPAATLDSTRRWRRSVTSASLAYQVDDQAMIFTRYSTGFRPGGYDDQAISAEGLSPYGLQNVESWELGMKSEWYDDTLRLNLATYKNYYENIVQRFPNQVSSGNIEWNLGNVASAEVTGYEAEWTWVPMDNFKLNGSYSHTQPLFDRYAYDDWNNPGTLVDLAGILKPEWAAPDSFYLSSQYSWPYWNGQLTAFAAYRYSTDYRTGSQTPLSKVYNYSRWDLAISYEWQEWAIRLFARNVKDKRYIQNAGTLSAASYYPQDPATLNPALTDPSLLLANPTLNQLVPAPLITTAEYNMPRFVGVEVIYTPDLNRWF